MQTLSRPDRLSVKRIPRSLIGTVLLVAFAVFSSQAEAASVSGRAVRRDGSNPPNPCRATLRAEVDRRGAPDTDLERVPDPKTSFSVPVNQIGEFHFAAIPANKYVLSVECATASAVREVDVQESDDIRIHSPLLLEDLTLGVVITPKLDPNGRPWKLTVDATMPRLRRIADHETTAAEGRWERRGMVAGNYRFDVSSSDGRPWLQRFFNLSANSGPLRLTLPFMQLSGQVRLSTKPVRARLIFHNEAGGEPVTLISDGNGFFQGVVPVTPGVDETKWTVEARAANPPISRRVVGVSVRTIGETSAWLDLTLPLFAVHGIVVSETGKRQNNAEVTLEEISNGAKISTATDDSGGFELEDLSPGKYAATAESIDGVSDPMPFQIAEGTESELKLVLNPSERVPFYVMSSHGPVAGAAVQVWVPPGTPHWFTRTDQNGHFEVKLPPGTAEVGLTVAAQGYALKMVRLQVSRDNDKKPDANTIELDTSGGMLVLNLESPGHVSDSSITPYLVHKGAIEAVGTIVGWSGNQTDAASHAPSSIEAIEPGVYALCLVADPAELSAFWFGALPVNRCRTGSVEQGETLTLSRP